MIKRFLPVFLILLLLACSTEPKKKDNEKLQIVCTTGMIGDAVKKIVGNEAEVITLMGPGVDPHLYKATQGDLKDLTNADIIIYNGLHLEGKMGEVFDKLEDRKEIIVAADAIEASQLINNTDFQGAHDPHIWFDIDLWSKVVSHFGEALASYSAPKAITFRQNSKLYQQELKALDEEVNNSLSKIDSAKRVLITAHDAFGYFGKAYHIEVKGLQGISTVSEYGLKDVSDLVNFISERGIKAVFVESSVSEKSLEAVVEGCKAKGHEVKIGGTLFSDAMGEDGTDEGTYVGMVRYNVATIIEGLQ